ncbi:MAG: hypothetical protein HY884_08320 [Deltaproteobacteria bacterium]|nr:hypothetical protein [Deltaproteobacteria bacterium]
MKIFKLPQLAELSGLAEYVLSAEGADSTALRWGRLLPNESGRKVSSIGTGTDIVYVVKGLLSVKFAKSAFPVSAGEAFFINGKTPTGGIAAVEFDNTGETDAVYIVASGHFTQGGQNPQTEKTGPSTGAIPPAADTATQISETTNVDDEFEITKDDPSYDDGKGDNTPNGKGRT